MSTTRNKATQTQPECYQPQPNSQYIVDISPTGWIKIAVDYRTLNINVHTPTARTNITTGIDENTHTIDVDSENTQT
jgi:hypothetical protein